MGVEGYVESGGLNHNKDGMENWIKIHAEEILSCGQRLQLVLILLIYRF